MAQILFDMLMALSEEEAQKLNDLCQEKAKKIIERSEQYAQAAKELERRGRSHLNLAHNLTNIGHTAQHGLRG